ncbi:MAG TPA: hypothetical protein VD833_01845 [Vicinamibacterales bacterium]|nr:hypothetical protein [Vicinamibacterales bacterium]
MSTRAAVAHPPALRVPHSAPPRHDPAPGVAEFFVISQTALPALLFLPGTQPYRLPLRVASFAISLALLAWWLTGSARAGRPHPARTWVLAMLVYVGGMVFHPFTSSALAGAAQLMLYLAVAAPLFWAPSVVRGPDHLARLMALLLVCNGVNASVGVLQVYDPERWMPMEFSRLVTESAFGLGAVTYMGPNGLIVRPPGLFDNPGAVAGPGMYAALLGLVFGVSAIASWKRLLALAASFAGVAAIYLSQVRVSLVIAVLMLAAYAGILSVQDRGGRAVRFGATAGLLVATTFSFALVLGGESIAERTLTLFERNPISLYSASRGGQLVYTFEELLESYPLGAGLGRWGMIAGYFGGPGNAHVPSLWAEIQVTGWAIDGGIPLLTLALGALAITLLANARVALRDPQPRVRACAAVILAANLGTAALIFSFTPFVTQIGLQFWFLAGALHGVASRARVPA